MSSPEIEGRLPTTIDRSRVGVIRPNFMVGGVMAVKELLKEEASDRKWTVISVLETRQSINISSSVVEKVRESCPDRITRHDIWELRDKPDSEFLCSRLEELLAIMDHALQSQGHGCFVHCAQGISRSVAVCVAWLISREKKTMAVSLREIQSVRPLACPNLGFLASLRALEQCKGDVSKAIERLHRLRGQHRI